MTNQQILEKAIQKAIDGGWKNAYWVKRFNMAKELDELPYLFNDETPSFESVIFSHDFAKALWGDEGFTTTGLKCDKHPGVQRYWQYHLQQMVIAEDPIKYLGENI